MTATAGFDLARCQCGAPLHVCCSKHPEHEVEPIIVGDAVGRVALDTRAPRRSSKRGPWKARHDRRCNCGAMFTPTGPRHTICPRCSGQMMRS